MSLGTRRFGTRFVSVLIVSAGFGLASCSSSDSPAEAPDESATVSQETPEQAVDIPQDTPAGEESQRIVDILNAAEDTTVDDWGNSLHASFTEEVSVDELVDLFNQNLRPAQPFTVTDYDGGDRQAVTTLASDVSDPLDMTVSVDTDGLITGLYFTPSDTDG